MKKIGIKLLAAFVMMGALLFPNMAFAADYATDPCSAPGVSDADKAIIGCNDTRTAPGIANNLFNIALSVIGVVSVIMLIFAGQRYVTANGDPGKITKSKTMIIYSIAGLVAALLGYAIINFVILAIE